MVKDVKSEMLLSALENSFSDTHTDGRFLQLSGLRIKAAWNRQEGRRILEAIFVPRKGYPQILDCDRMYTVAMVDFIASGLDGYSCFKHAATINRRRKCNDGHESASLNFWKDIKRRSASDRAGSPANIL